MSDKLNVFTVRDQLAESYLQPFFMKTKAQAIREITTMVNDPNSQFGKYPNDYVLFEIGIYDQDTGMIEPHKAPVSLGVLVEFKTQQDMFADLTEYEVEK